MHQNRNIKLTLQTRHMSDSRIDRAHQTCTLEQILHVKLMLVEHNKVLDRNIKLII